MIGFIVAGVPYLSRFVKMIIGQEKQEFQAYSSHRMADYSFKGSVPKSRETNSSWVAPREPDGAFVLTDPSDDKPRLSDSSLRCKIFQ
jgi:hypothetical protein